MALFLSEQALEDRYKNNFIQAVNEAYFGRTPGITRCFDAFCDFREKYLTRGKLNMNIIGNLSADHDKDLHRFVSEVERQFGFESFSFIIKNSMSANAYTYTIIFGDNLDRPSEQNVYMDKEGYHFRKELRVAGIVCVNSALLFDNKLSNEEAFSIVLHEIGHNFQKYLNGDVQSLTSINKLLYLYSLAVQLFLDIMNGNIPNLGNDLKTILLTNKDSNRAISKLYNTITSDESKANIYSYYNAIKGIISIPSSILTAIIMVPVAPIMGLVSAFCSLINNIIYFTIHTTKYLGEQMADAFPTYYGFGTSNIEVFKNKKLGSPFGPAVAAVSNLPLIGHIYNLMLLPAQLAIEISDEHPSNIVRCKAMIDSMKTDLDDPKLSPTLRKELKQQIDEAEKGIDDYYSKAIKINNPNLFKDYLDKLTFKKGGDGKYRLFKNNYNVHKGTLDMSNRIRESAIIDCKII